MSFHRAMTHAAATSRSITWAGATVLLVTGVANMLRRLASAASGIPAPYGVATNGALAYAEGGDIWVADTTGVERPPSSPAPRTTRNQRSRVTARMSRSGATRPADTPG